MTPTPSAFLDAHQVLAGPLPEEVSMEPIIEGVPFAYEKTVFDGADGFFAIWACDAGVFPRVKDKRGSFMYIISGDATITDQDGTSHQLTAGSVLVLPFGWVGTWHIRETIRKVYLHTTPAPPLPETVVPSAFVPAAQVLEGALPVVVFDGPDGHCAVQERAPGVYPQVKDDDGAFTYVISGEATVTDRDGTSHELTAGSVIALPRGWAGTWDIGRTIRTFDVNSTSSRQDTT
ncbi:cupin domain-containing protein [Nonomuraea sp. CA-143628]|uniref:cupin domain-containing protein n=1 Tax=Nonomuraea sp. CA-143628 TaxID=3239997 RepID=UPI003D928F3C